MNKSALHQACILKLEAQLEELKSAISKVQESVVGEENSTAGNKFETARAMGQEELDRLNRTLNNAIRELNILKQIDGEKACDFVQLGAVVKTTKKNMYMAVGLGKIELDGEIYFAISSSSPIGQQLMGMEEGGAVTFGGKKEQIIEIF